MVVADVLNSARNVNLQLNRYQNNQNIHIYVHDIDAQLQNMQLLFLKKQESRFNY